MVREWVGMREWGDVGLSFGHDEFLVLVGLTLADLWYVVECFQILRR